MAEAAPRVETAVPVQGGCRRPKQGHQDHGVQEEPLTAPAIETEPGETALLQRFRESSSRCRGSACSPNSRFSLTNESDRPKMTGACPCNDHGPRFAIRSLPCAEPRPRSESRSSVGCASAYRPCRFASEGGGVSECSIPYPTLRRANDPSQHVGAPYLHLPGKVLTLVPGLDGKSGALQVLDPHPPARGA